MTGSVLYSFKNIKEEEQGYWDLFEQYYHVKTRGALMLEALRGIGFSVEEDAIQFHPVNPYNNRRHACIIKAKKGAE